MSNSNTNLQTQSSNALHNAIMEAGSKDRPPMLEPGNYIILTREITISTTVDACLNACEMWKSYLKGEKRKSYKLPTTTIELHQTPDELIKKFALRIIKDTGMIIRRAVNVAGSRENVAGVQLNAEQADWKDDTDDESEEQELEAHYMYMAQIHEVTPDSVDNSGLIFDDEPMHKLFVMRIGSLPFRKSTCYIRDLKGNDLLTGSRGTDLYSISLQDSTTPNPICLMAKATSSQAWLWHRRLSHLNFDTINLLSKNNIVNGLLKLKFVKDHLCSSCELGKAKRKSFHTKTTPSSKDGYNFYT
ncbi:retrovirus-related pol polyprotein from transposon TNT 1-94 [Tanacetum coccineum]